MRTTPGLRGLFVLFLGVATATPVLADYTCSGNVTYLGLQPSGVLTVSVNNFGVWYLCDTSSAFSGNGSTYSAEACRAWYAAILSAQTTGQTISLHFASTSTGTNPPACSAMGSWLVPNPSPYHLRVMSP